MNWVLSIRNPSVSYLSKRPISRPWNSGSYLIEKTISAKLNLLFPNLKNFDSFYLYLYKTQIKYHYGKATKSKKTKRIYSGLYV
ncbi:hypothetical protein SAMN05444360_11495 [Chryseobacterium carnipullorum]|nr:hypothetical protein SAMN05444360_11495 [Chryseobacterium carnipullorum]